MRPMILWIRGRFFIQKGTEMNTINSKTSRNLFERFDAAAEAACTLAGVELPLPGILPIDGCSPSDDEGWTFSVKRTPWTVGPAAGKWYIRVTDEVGHWVGDWPE